MVERIKIRRWIFILIVLGITISCSRTDIHPPFKKAWELSFEKRIFGYGTGKGIILFTTENAYGMIDSNKGKIQWMQTLQKEPNDINIMMIGGIIYVAIERTEIIAYDARTFRKLWSMPMEGLADSVVVTDRMFICEHKKGVISAFELSSRKILWHYKARHKKQYGISYWALNKIIENKLILLNNLNDVVCLDARTGQLLWQTNLCENRNKKLCEAYNPVSDGHAVYLSSYNGNVIALDSASGHVMWQFKAYRIDYSPVVLADKIILTSMEGMMYVLDNKTGKQVWSYRLSHSLCPSIFNPVVKDNKIFAAGESTLFAFNASGDKLWEWESGILSKKTYIEGNYCSEIQLPPNAGPIDIMEDGVLISTSTGITLLKMSKRGDSRSEAFDELEYYRDLPARFSKMKEEEKRIYAGFLVAKIKKSNEKEYVPIMMSLFPQVKGWNNFSIFEKTITKSSHPLAVEYIIKQMANNTATPELRHEAYVNLARTGQDAGIKAVIAARDPQRTIPSLERYMGLDNLGIVPGSCGDLNAGREAYLFCYPKLLKTYKDMKGVLWGLIRSPIIGSKDDLWIARHKKKKWMDPFFTGADYDQPGALERFTQFISDAQIRVDTDHDGWTDLVEQRIGTNPRNPDTDGDGIIDSRDKNPLAAPHQPGQLEQSIAAAFEARFKFIGWGEKAPCLVNLPPGMEPFELTSGDWIIVTAKNIQESPLYKVFEHGVAVVYLYSPELGFKDKGILIANPNEYFLWNTDRTEMKLGLAVIWAGLAGAMYEMHLKKIGAYWVVLEEVQTGRS